MNPSTYAVAVDDTGATIIEDNTAPVAKEDGRCTYLVQNLGPDPVYLGGAEVAVGDGFELATGGVFTIAIRLGADLYGITDTGDAADVRVVKVP